MSEDLEETEESIAFTVKHFLTNNTKLSGDGWEVFACDLGEVEITTPGGQKFRLTVEEVSAQDDEVTPGEAGN